ncbi:fatty acid desaturase [Paenibacillus alginolyticus]|uniref:Fatty acid desaturase n=1 Tax=Paenibacillus alginolyticus TaxID=59839 RepID=A0ABT4GK84_9BACL|nr:fatty acid desaturase [Paenibacillus alginolyticus]MCY9670192.1 fatty acid desaturase [Paenibacillus alginolyticus]MCY9696620.1 fatty acid desaturase [Paenibacillus alginolyticus]MEC0145231.1 fatty acid desaturase [Paenibacillus alginolyticus]
MSATNYKRDYSLTGPENQRAQDKGLASADWYKCPIPRQTMKELMKRKDWPGIRDTLLWLVMLAGAGYLAYLSWGTWWAIPAFFFYGTLYMTPGDSRWHETAHGTPFKTPWINELMNQVSAFMILRAPTPWRWSHSRHHTDTIIVGRDAEIFAPRPPVYRDILREIFRLFGAPIDVWKHIMHCFGKMHPTEKDFVPETEWRRCFLESRITVLIYVGIVVWCISVDSILPAMFIGLPSFYGNFINVLEALSQHVGLHEDVLDHRLNTRTIYMNPFMRFIYWNMNYHIEHHMFPMVPYHALPALHKEMKHDCPEPYRNLFSALCVVIPALWKMRKDPGYTTVRPLPPTANPFKYGPHPYGTVQWPGDPRKGLQAHAARGAFTNGANQRTL